MFDGLQENAMYITVRLSYMYIHTCTYVHVCLQLYVKRYKNEAEISHDGGHL